MDTPSISYDETNQGATTGKNLCWICVGFESSESGEMGQSNRLDLVLDLKGLFFVSIIFKSTSRPPAHSWAGVVHSQLSPAQPSPAQNVRFLMLKIAMIHE